MKTDKQNIELASVCVRQSGRRLLMLTALHPRPGLQGRPRRAKADVGGIRFCGFSDAM